MRNHRVDKSVALRLFVAAYPALGAVQKLLAAARRLELPVFREVAEEQVHLTLHFIGDIERRELPEVIESVGRSAAGVGAFTLTARRLIALPEHGPSRLIAAETDAPAELVEIHRRLVHRLVRSVKARENDRFRPHMTLLRFRSPARGLFGGSARPREIEPIAFDVSEIHLVRSNLKAGGAEHMTLHTVRLETAFTRT